MSVKAWLQIAAMAIVLTLAAGVVVVWHAQQIERAQLQAKLKNAEQALTEANARQASRDAELQQRVAQLEEKKVAVQKPAEVLNALPEVLSLPKPLVMEQPAPGAASSSNSPVGVDRLNPKVILPAEDLKPLYDAAVECQECQVKLAAVAADLKDEKSKTVTLSRERDDALRVAKGGSVLRRVARAAKWFVIGAAAGAAAAKLAH